MNFELISAVAGADFGLGCRRHARARVAGFSVSTPTPYRQICRLLLLHLHTHTSTANHLFLVHTSCIYSIYSPDLFRSIRIFSRTVLLARTRLSFESIDFTSFLFLFTFRLFVAIILSFLLLLPFYLSIFSRLLVCYLWPPTLTRHFTHYHWYGTITDAGGKKRISLVGGWWRLRRAACDGRRDTGHGFQIIRFSLCFRAMIVPSIAHRSKRASPPSRYDFSGRRYDSFMVITIPSTSRWRAIIKQRVFRRSGPPSWSNTAVPARKLGCDGDRGDGTRREKRREERGPCQVLEAVSCVLLG